MLNTVNKNMRHADTIAFSDISNNTEIMVKNDVTFTIACVILKPINMGVSLSGYRPYLFKYAQ